VNGRGTETASLSVYRNPSLDALNLTALTRPSWLFVFWMVEVLWRPSLRARGVSVAQAARSVGIGGTRIVLSDYREEKTAALTATAGHSDIRV
jgi:hypothetical protein